MISIPHSEAFQASMAAYYNPQVALAAATGAMYAMNQVDRINIKLPFPWKLHQLLEDVERDGNQNVVSWLADGTAFRVHKPAEFTSRIMANYFRQTKYKSFTRQLYVYGFSRVGTGANRGAFYHPCFVRNNKTLSLSMRRKKLEPQSSRTIASMDNQFPLPVQVAQFQLPAPPMNNILPASATQPIQNVAQNIEKTSHNEVIEKKKVEEEKNNTDSENSQQVPDNDDNNNDDENKAENEPLALEDDQLDAFVETLQEMDENWLVNLDDSIGGFEALASDIGDDFEPRPVENLKKNDFTDDALLLE